MTDKMSREDFEKFIDDLFDEMMEEMKEESVQEPVSTCVKSNMTFTQVLQYLENEYAQTKALGEYEEESDYYLMVRHPLLKEVYLTLIEDCKAEGWKTIIYPYIAAVDKNENKVEDFHFPKEAWFDNHWEIHKIPLN